MPEQQQQQQKSEGMDEHQVSAGCFPKLTDGRFRHDIATKGLVGKTAVDVSFLSVHQLGSSELKKYGAALESAFNTAWAMVLAKYSGGDRAKFLAIRAQENAWKAGVCEVDLSSNISAAETLRIAELNFSQRAEDLNEATLPALQGQMVNNGYQIINTVVTFSENSEIPPNSSEHDFEGDYISLDITAKAPHLRAGNYNYKAELSYPESLLPSTTAKNVASTYSHILRQIVQHPAESILALDYMSDEHLRQIAHWNHKAPKVVSNTVPELFREQVRARPYGLAVYAHDGTMTYEELDRASDVLSYHLINHGVKRDVVVPLSFEKSKWAIISMLAVVKAGGAIVNLDVKQPVERLMSLLAQVDAKFILASAMTTKFLEERIKVFTVDERNLASLPLERPSQDVEISPSSILYIIFTSGSTGVPKGCVVEHQSFLTGAARQADLTKMTTSSRILQMTPYTFDVSMLEIFTVLTNGACICSASDELLQTTIANVINTLDINWVFMTPSMIRTVNPTEVPTLKTLALGGEALAKIDVTTWADKLHLFNGYGPSECSVAATINSGLCKDEDPANIGFGEGAICWVVDPEDHNHLVPIGSPGELVLQGPIVARGYLNNPAKTAEVFVDAAPDFAKMMPWAHQNFRLYKTGDLVRYNSDGSINFIGRKDKQVKLRGQRLELGEIEYHLSTSSHVEHALVSFPQTGLCRQMLVAVLALREFSGVATNDGNIGLIDEGYRKRSRALVQEIRQHLSKYVPGYMVPSAWLILKSIPRTTSGKLNSMALKHWLQEISEEDYNEIADVAAEEGDSAIVAIAIEKRIQEVWANILNISASRVGLKRSFISLGGDSISAMKVAAGCRAQNMAISVRDVLQTNNVAELALRVVDEPSESLVRSSPSERVAIAKDLFAKEVESSVFEQVEDVYECSSMQEGILLAQIKFPGTYQIRQVAKVNAAAEPTIFIAGLQDAWRAVVARHPIMRTFFVSNGSSDGQFFQQMVLKHYEPETQVLSYTGQENSAKIADFLKSRPLPNYSAYQPQHKLTICHTAAPSLYLLVEINHALIDGGSTGVLMEDLAKAFDGILPQSPGPLYSDYISYLQSTPIPEHEKYWRNRLAGVQPSIVPMFPPRKNPVKEIQKFTVHSNKLPDLLHFSESHGATLANVMQLAWAMVLRAYTGNNDVLFGYVTSGRDVPVQGIVEAIGAFINLVPCRVTFGQDTQVAELVQQLQDDYLSALPHQQYSLAKIQNDLNMSGMPLFNSILSVQNHSAGGVKTGTLSFSSVQEDDPTDFDLTINVTREDGNLEISIGYWSSLLSVGDVANMASTFSGAIDLILVHEQSKVADLDLFNERDREQIWYWNRNEPTTVPGCVHEYVYRQVLSSPEKQAVDSWDGDFTYAELHRLSNKLAYYLHKLGVGPEVLVPHCFDKSKWSTVTTLAIMKAGGGSVGLSPTHPVERLQAIIESCSSKVVVAAHQHVDLFKGIVDKIIDFTPEFIASLPDMPTTFALPHVAPENTAFVSFTSGSTGKPKGIVLQHNSLITSIQAHGNKWNVGPQSRVIQFSAYAFDASMSDTFTTLVLGGTVCIPSEDDRLNDLAGAINRLGVNWAFLTPRLIGTLSPRSVPGLKHIVLGGEAIKPEDIDHWVNEVSLRLVYGPTECTIYSSGTEPLIPGSDPLSLGRAVGTRFWVIVPDHTDRLAPVGCIGELVIEGPLVTRGYLNDPVKTAEAFFQDPAWMPKDPLGGPRRFYKTRDLVRYYADGQFQFVGRMDTQVKVRGQRVELSEIEQAICSALPEVVHVVVDSVVYPSTGQTVIAYLHMRDPQPTSTTQLALPLDSRNAVRFRALERDLAKRLPVYMIPAMFVPIAYSPVTLTGKIDRVCLRTIALKFPPEEREMYALSDGDKSSPATLNEAALQTLWAAVLSRKPETIGTSDSFFRLGGDSIGAIKLVSAARGAGFSLAVADVFRHPELSDLATYMASNGATADDVTIGSFQLLVSSNNIASLVDDAVTQMGLETADLEDIYPCAPFQEGVFLISTMQPGSYLADMAFKLGPGLDLNRFQSAWQKLVDEHSILRTRIVALESQSYQAVIKPSASAIHWHHYHSMGEFKKKCNGTLNFGQPLARYSIIEDADGPIFAWTAHHALYDGWSVQLLLQKLQHIYEHGEPEPQEPYNRFIKDLQSRSLDEATDFWRRQLSGDVPASFPRLPHANYEPVPDKFRRHAMKIRAQPCSSTTMSILLRAAWAIVVSRYSDSEDIVYGLTLFGRDAQVNGIEHTLGPTITTVPIKLHLDKEQTIKNLLNTIQNQNADIAPFQHTGLQTIRRVDANATAACDFKNLLVIQPQADGSTPFPGLKQVPIELTGFDSYALVVECMLGSDCVEFEARFDSGTISEYQVERLLFQFEHVVAQMNISTSSTRIMDVNLLSESDRQQILEWNKNIPETRSHLVHDIFMEQVALHPEVMAVESWDGNLTYRELDDYSSSLALHLTKEIGIRPEEVVPICFNKSVWTIVVMLAVMKAGGACAMLNPDHPVERLVTVLEDTNCRITLTSRENKHLFDTTKRPTLAIDNLFVESLPSCSRATIRSFGVVPTNPAYILFTSGSTGKPKGIIVQHDCLCTVALDHGEAHGVGGVGSRNLQFANYTFDVSVAEIFITLMKGGTLCVITEHDRINNLAGVVNEMRISWLFLTPTVAALLDPQDVPNLRTLTLGGEAISQSLIDKWVSSARIINSYGPAEGTIWTSSAIISHSVSPNNIGKGIASRLWVVESSDHNMLTPIGCVGELLIEGPNVARGYINEPEKTKAAFIENPAWMTDSISSSHRIYKTGDLVRYEADGSLTIVGRKDSQVKFNGQRIELGEIEFHLQTCPEIETAMVSLPKAGLLKGKLVGILALTEFEPLALEGTAVSLVRASHRSRGQKLLAIIKESLAIHLPLYMIPTIWVLLESIPLTASRKVNRVPISKWITEVSEETHREIISMTKVDFTLPITANEKELANIWSRVLNIPVNVIGSKRSFLSLGGDSITAMQVVSLARKEGLNLNVSQIIKSKNLVELASCAKSLGKWSADAKEQFDTHFPLSPIQSLYFDQIARATEGKTSHRYNQSVLLRISKPVSDEEMRAVFQHIVSQHSMLRARFVQNEDNSWSQIISSKITGTYVLESHKSSRVDMFCTVEMRQKSINIEDGPVFAVDLFALPDGACILSMIAHHLVVDVVSWHVILEDIEQVLATKKFEIQPSLPFQAWQSMQANNAKDLDISKVIPKASWTNTLEYWGLSALPKWEDIEHITFLIDQNTTSLLMGEANNALRTQPMDLILASLHHSFSSTFYNRAAPSILCESHGRHLWNSSLDLSNIVGWFTTLFPLHIPAISGESCVEIVKRTKHTRAQYLDNGFAYFSAYAYSAEAEQIHETHKSMEICFNYLGHQQQLEREDAFFRQVELLDGEAVTNVGRDMGRLSVFDVTAEVVQGQLSVSVDFNKNIAHQDKIHAWFANYAQSLKSVARKLSQASAEYTISDFPLMNTNDNALSAFVDEVLPSIGVQPADVQDLYPCAPIQEGIIISQAAKEGTYHVRQCLEVITGDESTKVSVQRLESAWQKVIDRHTILRTIFIPTISGTGLYDQLVLRNHAAAIKHLKYDGADPASFMESRVSLDFTLPVPHHCLTICEAANKIYCQLEISHALIDGTSTVLLFDDLASLYGEEVAKSSALPFGKYIQYLQSLSQESSLEYWRSCLSDMESCYFPRLVHSHQSTSSTRNTRSVTIDLVTEVSVYKFCEEHEITAGNLFQAAWGLILRAYTGNSDVCFGYMASGRDIPLDGVTEALGPYINLLICRMQLEAEASIESLLSKLQSDYLKCLPHQHTSVATIQHALGKGHDALFNTIMSVQRLPHADGLKKDIEFKIAGEADPTEYDIDLNITAADRGIEIHMTYAQSHLSQDQAYALIHRLGSAISSIIQNHQQPMSSINLCTEQEKHQMQDWIGAEPVNSDVTVHHLIEQWALSQPNAEAIVSSPGDSGLTYGELDAIATLLSAQILNLGLHDNQTIYLCFEKSAITVLSMLAVLKAGSAYCIISPAEISATLKSDDVVLCSPDDRPKIDEITANVITVEKDMFVNGASSAAIKSAPRSPQRAAFFLNGQKFEHHIIATAAINEGSRLQLSPRSRVLQLAPYSSYLSNVEILFTLCNGGTICMPMVIDSTQGLVESFKSLRVTWAILTPILQGILSTFSLPEVSTIVINDDGSNYRVSTKSSQAQVLRIHVPPKSPHLPLLFSAHDSLSQTTAIENSPSYRMWIFNGANHEHLAPIGCVGELVLEGSSGTRGSAAKAVIMEQPSWVTPGCQLFRTGCLARYSEDGTIWILNANRRNDMKTVCEKAQSVLPSTWSVALEKLTVDNCSRSAMFVCSTPEFKTLVSANDCVSVITPSELQDLNRLKSALTGILAKALPELYIPINFWPFNSELQLDRTALRTIGSSLSTDLIELYSLHRGEKMDAFSANEKILSQLWAEALGIPASSFESTDNFFSMGGDSVGAMALVNAARNQQLFLTVATIFKHPTLSAMANELSLLTMLESTTRPFSLLKDLSVSDIKQEATEHCQVSIEDIEDIYPCTPLQEGLMSISAQHASAYKIQEVFTIPENLNIQRFKYAWGKVASKTAILRTRIISTFRGSFQVVLKENITWTTKDSLETYLTQDSALPFVYGQPLARWAIVGVAGSPKAFVWTAHHSIYDGLTFSKLAGKVSAIYKNESVVPEVPYSRFIQYIQQVDHDQVANFWKAQFKEPTPTFPQLPNIMYKATANQVQSTSIAVQRADSDITLSTVLRAAWALTLAGLTDSDAVTFGATLSGRNAPVTGITHITGPTLCTVPIRIDTSVSRTALEFLNMVQDHSIEMIPFEQTGLSNIRRFSEEAREAADIRNLLLIQPAAASTSSADFLGLQSVELDREEFDPYPLVVECGITHMGVEIKVQYDEQILSTSEVQTIIRQFENKIRILNEVKDVSTTEELTLNSSNLVDPDDIKQIVAWNCQLPSVIESCLHTEFEKQARSKPDALAIYSFDTRLTYAEVNQLANNVAHYLITNGVKSGVIVPLCFEKCSWTIIVELAVMKAGGAVCMLNPEHPANRLKTLIKDVSAHLVITSDLCAGILSEIVAATCLIEVNERFLRGLPDFFEDMSIRTSPSNPAFVNFTSGSTGKPKAIILEHKSMVSGLLVHGKEMGIGPNTRTFQFASYVFDVSIEEVFCTLMLGGCVCVPSDEERMSDIAGAMNRYRVTWSELTPTVASLLMPTSIPTLQVLALSGESLTKEVVRIWSPYVKLVNTYGPSECSVSTTCSTNLSQHKDPSNIGYGFGCNTWITDPNNVNRLAPIGAVGELLVSGPIVARGYLNEREKTSAAFIQNPDWITTVGREQLRLYRTGDLVKYNWDGSIKFIGRRDSQIKLHGQRIEVGEIEHAIKDALENPSYQVVVELLAPQSRNSVKALTAFICETDKRSGSIENLALPMSKLWQEKFLVLRQTLFLNLPKHMVPSVYIPVKYIPLSTSGKLDRKGMREYGNNLSVELLSSFNLLDALARAPSTTTEKTLCNLCSDILGQKVGPEDNFFLVGGDSLGAMTLVAAAAKIGVRFTVATVLKEPVLSNLAQIIDKKSEVPSAGEVTVDPFTLIPQDEVENLQEECSRWCGVHKDDIEDIYPCTPLQEGLMSITARDETAYISRSVFRLPLDMNLDKFKDAWHAVAEREAILRTTIVHTKSAQSLQVVLRQNITWQSAATIDEYLRIDTSTPIRHGQAMMRFGLVPGNAADSRAYFIYTAHHSVYDGWSEATLFGQVGMVYNNKAHNLPPVAPYKNFLAYLSRNLTAESSKFWREQFEGKAPAKFPELPSLNYEAHPTSTYNHGIKMHRNNGAAHTTSTILKCAWSLLLNRYTGNDDVVYGHVLSGRTVPVDRIRDMVGPTIATVPVCFHVDHTINIKQLLQQVHDHAMEITPFEQTGLHRLRRESREIAAINDFNHLFYIQPSIDDVEDELGLEVLPNDNFEADTYALLVECQVSGNDIVFSVRYDQNVLSKARVTWMMHHLEVLVHQLTSTTLVTPVGQLTPYGAHDLEQITKWNGPAIEPLEECVHRLFEYQARLNPKKEAIHGWDGSMTYSELDDFTNALSIHLRHIGVGPETMVPMCFSKSKWAIVSQLAVLKAGGACVMLNPAHPIKRLSEIVADLGASHVLTAPEHAHLLQDQRVIAVTVDESITTQFSSHHVQPSTDVQPTNAAYVVFTSGSTGKPKAVVIDHRAISTSIRDHSIVLGLNSQSRVLNFAAYNFDISFGEIFSTLACGGTVCVIAEHDRMNNLSAAINNLRVNWACLTPTAIPLVDPSEVPNLRTLVVSGEAPTRSIIETWAGKVDKLTNIYGPSEASIWCSCFEQIEATSSHSNIGRPVGCRLWIVEPNNADQLAPVGCVGELLVEGPILARGYWGDEEKTKKSFITAPEWMRHANGTGDGILYKTGDLAKYNLDGTIEYLGRNDTQVKLNGQRVEIQEIEHHIKSFLATSEVVVDIITTAQNKKLLVAFFANQNVTTKSTGPEGLARPMSDNLKSRLTKLQTTLASILPIYMIPSIFVPLHALPVLDSAKTNRKLLRNLVHSLSDQALRHYSLSRSETVAPKTTMEVILVNLWAQVLGIDPQKIGTNDSFFSLGGDSITAMQLASSARRVRISISVAEIFRHPTIADAAKRINARDPPTPTSPPIELLKQLSRQDITVESALKSIISTKIGTDRDNIEGVLPTTNFQDMALTGHLTRTRWMLNYFWFDGTGSIDVSAMRQACHKIVDTFDILRTVFVAHEGRFLQVFLQKLKPSFTKETTNDFQASTTKISDEDRGSSFQIEDPLVKFYLLQHQSGQKHRLIMRLSHAQYDGVSLPYLWETLRLAYAGLSVSPTPKFYDYAKGLSSVDSGTAKDHWSKLLANSSMTSFVSRSKPRLRGPLNIPFTLTLDIPHVKSSLEHITFATIIKSAWALVISKKFSQRDVVFGHTISGRNSDIANIDKIAGPCLNIIPVRVQLQSGWKNADLLNFVQEQQLSNIPFEGIGSTTIIKECTHWPHWSYFSSIIQHQNISPDESINFGDSQFEPGFMGADLDLADVSILSTPLDSKIEISLTSSSEIMSQSSGQALLQELCQIIQEIASDVEAGLPSMVSDPADVPIQQTSGSQQVQQSIAYPLGIQEELAIRADVISVWEALLPSINNTSVLETDFFHAGGDIVNMAHVYLILRDMGYKVSIEELVENSTIRGMIELLSGRV